MPSCRREGMLDNRPGAVVTKLSIETNSNWTNRLHQKTATASKFDVQVGSIQHEQKKRRRRQQQQQSQQRHTKAATLCSSSARNTRSCASRASSTIVVAATILRDPWECAAGAAAMGQPPQPASPGPTTFLPQRCCPSFTPPASHATTRRSYRRSRADKNSRQAASTLALSQSTGGGGSMPYSAFVGRSLVLGDQHVGAASGGGVGAFCCMSQQVFQERNTEDGMESIPGAAAAAAEEVLGGHVPDVEGGRRAASVQHHAVPPAELNGASHLNGHAAAAAISSNHAAHLSVRKTTPHHHHHQVSVHETVPIIPRPPRLDDAASRMKALGKEGKWREVMSVLRKLQRDAKTDSALRPDLVVFNAAVGAVSKSGRWEEALGLLEEIRAAGFSPDVRSYTSVAAAGSRSGKVAKAESLLDRMRAEGVHPNTATYNAVIMGCADGGEWRRAVHLLEKMRGDCYRGDEVEHEVLSYTLAIKAAARDGEWEVAIELLEEMQAEGLQPTTACFRHAISAIGDSCCEQDREGPWRRCVLLLDKMHVLDLELDEKCLRHAIKTAANADDVDAALELIDRMEASTCYRNVLVYNQVIAACGRRHNWQQALSILGRIRRAGITPDAYSFASAMYACARGGEPRRALQLLHELKLEGSAARPNTVVYNTLLALCKGNPIRGGHGRGTGGSKGAASAAVKTGTGTVPLAVAQKHQNGFSSGGFGGVSGLPSVSFNSRDLAVDRREVGGAEEVRGRGVDGLTGCREADANSRSAAGDVGGGSSEWGQEPEELMRTALTLLDEMIEAAGRRDGRRDRDCCAPDRMSFELTMQACVNAGHPKEALKVFDELRRRVRGGGTTERIRLGLATYRLGLTAASAAGDGAAAAVVLEEMKNAGVAGDESCYKLAAAVYARSGLWRQGLRLTQMAAGDGVILSPSILTSIIGACAKGGRWEEALDVLQTARPLLRRRRHTAAHPELATLLKTGCPRAGLAVNGAQEAIAAAGKERLGKGSFSTIRNGGGGGGGGGRWSLKDGGKAVAAYMLAMVACRAAGKHAKGLQVLAMLWEDGVSADEMLYHVALSCCAKAKAPTAAARGEAVAVLQVEEGVEGRELDGAAVADRILEEMSARRFVCGVEGFTNVAQAYGLAGRWEDALALIPRAAAAMSTIAGACLDEQLYCSVINALGDNGAWQEAVTLIQSMRSGAAVDGSGGSGEVTWISRSPSSSSSAAAAAGAASSGVHVSPGQSAYDCACRACAKAGQPQAVLGLMEHMREDGVARNAAMYASLIRAFAERGEWEQAVELVRFKMTLDGVEPDAASYHQALRACRAGAGGDGLAAVAAECLVKGMASKGLDPDVTSFEILARVCLEDGRPDLALDAINDVLHSCRETGGGAVGQLRWSTADLLQLERLCIVVLGRVGQWEQAVERLDVMRARYGDSFDESAFVAAAYACALSGQWSMIQVLLSEAQGAMASTSQAGEKPLVTTEALWEMRRALLAGLGKAGRWRQAVEELQNMYGRSNGGSSSDVPSVSSSSSSSSSSLTEATAPVGSSSVAVNGGGAAGMVVGVGAQEATVFGLDDFLKPLEGSKHGVAPRRVVDAVDGDGRGGGGAHLGADEAAAAATVSGEGGGRPNPSSDDKASSYWQSHMLKDYRTVMHACVQSGQWDMALDLWTELRNRANAPQPCSATYAAALRAYGGGGGGGGQVCWDTARILLGEMRAAGGGLAPTERHYALAARAAAIADEDAVRGSSSHGSSDPRTSGGGGGGGGGGEVIAAEVTAARVESDGAVEQDGKEPEECSERVIVGGGAALSSLMDDMEAEGRCPPGWEFFVAVSSARAHQGQWYRASAGVLELMRERGVRNSCNDGSSSPKRHPAAANFASRQGGGGGGGDSCRHLHLEGVRGLYARLMLMASRIKWGTTSSTAAVDGDGVNVLLGDASRTIRDVLADADERLAPPLGEGEFAATGGAGGVGPQLLAIAARAFARAGDWEGARDVALRLCDEYYSSASVGGMDLNNGAGHSPSPSERKPTMRTMTIDVRVRATAKAAAAVALSAAVSACAAAGEIGEAEALAARARVLAADQRRPSGDDMMDESGLVSSFSARSLFSPAASSASAPSGGGGGGDRSHRRQGSWEGLDLQACVALAAAYDEVGRVSDAEALRQRLLGEVAADWGVETATSGTKAGTLPTLGGDKRRRRRDADGGDDHGSGAPRGDGGGGPSCSSHDAGYNLYLDLMAEEEEDGSGGVSWDEENMVNRRGVGAGKRPSAPWGGLTELDLVGW